MTSLSDPPRIEDLATYFRSFVHRHPPKPELQASLKPIERFWPANKQNRPPAGLSILSRHPAFTFDFLDAPEFKVGRSPRSASRGRQSRFHSLKSRRTLRAASDLERDHFLISEFDDNVIQFLEQPLWVRYPLSGRLAKHRPDCFVYMKPESEFREIKYEKEASTPENEERWSAIGPALSALGYGYRVLTERHIRQQPRYQNVWAIFESRMTPLPAKQALDDIAQFLRTRQYASVAELLARFGLPDEATIYALIRRGFLSLNLDGPLSLESDVSLAGALRRGPQYSALPRPKCDIPL